VNVKINTGNAKKKKKKRKAKRNTDDKRRRENTERNSIENAFLKGNERHVRYE